MKDKIAGVPGGIIDETKEIDFLAVSHCCILYNTRVELFIKLSFRFIYSI